MATTSFGIRPSRYIRQAATDTLQDKTNYVSIMQNLMLGLQGGTWTAARSPLGDVGMPQHDFAKGPYLGGQYDAYKMCGLYNETTMKYFGYAGCVAYRFKVPDSYRGHYDAETCYLKEIVIPATRDRFLKSGYRIHAVASDAELPSSDWGVIHAESDASGSDVTVYRMAPLASQEGVTYLVDAMPLSTRHQVDVTQKAEAISQKNYVYVYLTLNDYTDRWTKYNTKEARLYAIEGAAAMNPDDFVFSWEDANGIVVPDDAPPPMEFNVCRGGVLPPLVGEVSGIQTLDVSFDGVNITDSTDRMLKPGMKNVEDVDSANGLRTLYGLFYNGEAKQLQTSEFSELKSMARPGASFAVSIRNEDGDIQPFSNIKRTKFKEGGFFDGVAFGDGVFVACDFNSGAWYSTDKGRTWTHGNVNKDFFYVAFGNGVFVAGTDSGSSGEGIWRSTDGGKTWTQSSIADGDWGGIVYSNGVFIIGGANTTGQGIWRSTDGGITWTQSNQTTGRWRSFAEGNGVVVAGEIGGKISYSNDLGITWTQCDVITSNWTSIAYGNGVFIACCSTSDERIWRSTDGGVTWNVSACRSVQPVGISYGNGIFSIADYNNGVFYSIDDGETFKQVRYIEYGEVVSAVCYGDGEFIYLGRGFAYYNDFKNEVEPLFEVIETSERYDVIVFGEGVFIASGEYTKAKRSTDNGRTWSEIQPNIKLKSLAYGSGVFLGRAESYLIRSVDKGLTWTNISNEFNFTEISFGNGLFVASAGNGLFYSTDGGVTWTQSNITSAVNVKMAFGNGVFVALNMYNGDKNFYSTDGRTWKKSKFNKDSYAVAFGDGIFIAVKANAYNGEIWRSTNGIDWEICFSSSKSYYFNCCAYGNGVFIVGVDYSSSTTEPNESGCYYSTDRGNTWKHSSETKYIHSIAFGNGAFVAGGREGDSAQSQRGLLLYEMKTAYKIYYSLTSSLMTVRTSVPLDFRASRIRLDWSKWNGRATPGAKFNVWMKRGEFTTEYDEEIVKNNLIYTAKQTDVAGYKLVGVIDADLDDKTATLHLDKPLTGEVVTFLLSAYISMDNVNPPSSTEMPVGAATEVYANSVKKSVYGLDMSWRPDITLLE